MTHDYAIHQCFLKCLIHGRGRGSPDEKNVETADMLRSFPFEYFPFFYTIFNINRMLIKII